MSNYQQFMLALMGWRDGAGGRPMHSSRVNNRDYSDGYLLGRKARRDACESIARQYGITDHQIQLSFLRQTEEVIP